MKRSLKSTISLLLCFVMLLCVVFTGCDEEKNADTPSDQTGTMPDADVGGDDTTGGDEQFIPSVNVTIDTPSIALSVGESVTLTATVMPENASDKNVTWTSSNDAIAFVVNGSVTAVGEGTAVIIATTSNGKTATCTVTVNKLSVDVSDISLDHSTLEMTTGYTAVLNATVMPEDASDKNLTWASSNTSVVTVNNGVVTAVKAGSAIITVTTSNGKSATCSVIVTDTVVDVTGVWLNKTSLALTVGDSSTLSATVLPSNASDKNVTWKSSNTNVATVSNGKVTAVGAGSATITVTTSNGKTATCSVTAKATVSVTSVSLSQTNLSLKEGDSAMLSATVFPSNATDKSVTWKSSDTSVVTVNNGEITAVGEGSATITVTASNGKTATCSVMVSRDPFDDFYYMANTTGYTITGVKNEDKTSYVVPSNVTQINAAAFAGCNSMESITLPGEFGHEYFGAIFGKLYDPNATAMSQGSETYYIPTSLKSVTVIASIASSSIGDNAFYGCSALTSVTIGDSVTSVGDSAFYGCSALTSVTIGNSVTSIGDRAFYQCSNINSVYIIDIAAWCKIDFGSYANPLSNKQNFCLNGNVITELVIPDSVTRIGNRAFSGFSGLTSITIGDGVRGIGEEAFRGCSGLTNITIPDRVTGIGEGAFSGCSGLENITLPFVGNRKTTTTSSAYYQYPLGYIFGTSVYAGGVATKQQYFGNSLSNYTYSTYYIPASLKSVTITGGNITGGAFYNCSRLTSITIGDGVTSINDHYAFYNCSGLTRITIPDSVTYIGTYAFYGCSGLTSVTIGDSVTSIGMDAFCYCSSLTSVTIGDSVTSIGQGAFYGCSSLTMVTFEKAGHFKAGTGARTTLGYPEKNAIYLTSTYVYDTWKIYY